LTNSPIKGNNGTIEYLIGLSTYQKQEKVADIDVNSSINNAFKLEKFDKNNYEG